MTTTTSTILYADDDSDDRLLWGESMQLNGLQANMVYVSNGLEAISYIEEAKAALLPALIILDLNMPKMNGLETLHYLKARPEFQAIPVMILSTSENKREMEYYRAQGASYFVKPSKMAGYSTIVHACLPYVATGQVA